VKIYVVIGVYGGVVDSVHGYRDDEPARTQLAEVKRSLDIQEGYEEESENDAKIYELEI